MVERADREETKKELLKPEGLAVLSYRRAGHISSRVVERELRKLRGVKEIAINPISYVVKIHFNPSVVSAEKMRSVLKSLANASGIETRQVPSRASS